MRPRVANGCAAFVSFWLFACTATTELDGLGSGGAAGSSSNASTSASSATVGSGGAGGIGAGGNGGSACDYASRILSDTPLGYWRLDELATPDAYDATSNDNDGLYVLGVTLGEPGAFAQSGTAVRFDGTGRVDFGDRFDFPGTLAFSIELWVRADVGASGALIGKLDYLGPMDYAGYILYVSAAGTITFARRPGSSANLSSVLPDAFSHVVATYDGVTLRIYVDGVVQDNTEHMGAIADVEGPFFIADATSWSNLPGVIDEVAVYGYALTSQQVADHYACAQ